MLTIAVALFVLAVLLFGQPRTPGRLALLLVVVAVPAVALAQAIDGGTVVGILPVSDRAKANIAWGWLGLFYLAGILKRFTPPHTIVGKALDFITQDTRPPPLPTVKNDAP